MTRPPCERRDDLLGDDHAGAVLCLFGRRGQVRGQHDVRRRQQRPGVRLLDEHVERGAGDLPGLEGADQRRVVDQVAARGVDDANAVAHLRDRRVVDRAARVRRQRQVQRQEVRRVRAPRRAAPLSTPSSRKRSAGTNGS